MREAIALLDNAVVNLATSAKYRPAQRVLEAAYKVDERDLGRVFMGFVSEELRALLEAIREAKKQ
jgi:hypothetical protein